MFLFKRKKENTEAKLAAEEAKVKKALEQKEKEDLARAKKDAAAAKVVKVEAVKINTGKEAPVKVVVPASSLKEETQPLAVVQAAIPAAEVSDELVDSLLVKVTREGPDESTAPALTDIIPIANLAPTQVPAAAPIKVAASAAPIAAIPVQAAPVVEAAKQEAKPAETPKAPVADAKKGGEEEKGNLFSNLFGKAEVEEETYLDRLIKSLPDITIEEVMSEAEEVKGLMSEWTQGQTR